jgi:hypothetical protein
MTEETTVADGDVAAAIAKATEGLKAKNTELLGKLKAKGDEFAAMKAQLDELSTAQSELETDKATKAGDFDKLKEQLSAKHAKELATAQDALKSEQSVTHQLLVESGLTDALTKAKVPPHFLDAARALIKTSSQIELQDIDGKRAATISGKPLTDFVTEWAGSDTGKHFVAAPATSGGNAQGAGQANGTAKTIDRKAFDALPQSERASRIKDGVKVVDAA